MMGQAQAPSFTAGTEGKRAGETGGGVDPKESAAAAASKPGKQSNNTEATGRKGKKVSDVDAGTGPEVWESRLRSCFRRCDW